MMYKIFSLFCFLLPGLLIAQNKIPQVDKTQIVNDIYFLASDELQGRKVGEFGNLVAARYIAEEFRKLGLKQLTESNNYYQDIPFVKRTPAETGGVTLRDTSFAHGEDVLLLAGNKGNVTLPLIFAEQAWVNDTLDQFAGLDVSGKMVISIFGIPGSQNPRAGFTAVKAKRKAIKERGGLGLIEIYTGQFPWSMIKGFMNREQLTVSDGEEINNDPFILSSYNFSKEIARLKAGENVEVVIESSGVVAEETSNPNVIGYLKGRNPALNNEYVIVSAHFDHVGMSKDKEGDNIFNGARDNAIGVSAILSAARYFKENRPERSLLFIAYNAEEVGLLGSAYYSEHPVLPLRDCIFNMNIDGGGYNDTTIVTVIGHDRVGVLDIFQSCAAEVGLKVIGDPAPGQGLFDRSDNVNLAAKGIPAPTYAPGMTAFDDEINKYYHQVTDHAEGLNYSYLRKYAQAYILTTEKIANIKERPTWAKGDKYEKAYNKLIQE